MRILNGIAASGGISCGKALVFTHNSLEVSREKIEPEKVKEELEKFDIAVEKSMKETQALFDSIDDDTRKEILETHIIMLQDPEYLSEIKDSISIHYQNAAWAVESVTASLIATLESSDIEMLRDRAIDLSDISRLLIENLSFKRSKKLSQIKKEVILVADSLLPSEMLTINKKWIKAIAVDTGGRTSHVAIFARSFGIPTVLGLYGASLKARDGDEVILDGNEGQIVIRPEWYVKKKFEITKANWEAYQKELLTVAKLPVISPDKKDYVLKANIETADEVAPSLEKGASGIGLFRSEFLFLQKNGSLKEDVQFEAYKEVLEKMNGNPVTIRTIDIGGDKAVAGLGIDEENPILGWRAIRFCLERKDIFRIQLRALLRSSIYGKLHIMFPMISGLDELEQTLLVYKQVQEELRANKIPFDEDVKIGTMIEVPSAALISDELAKRVDFFSIGTNDLIQYTIAVDRGNEKIAHLYQPFHPGVLRLIKIVIDNAHKENIPIGMCGEMASNPYATVLLAGLGLDEFSMSPSSLLEVRKILRTVKYSEAKQMSEKVLKMNSSKEIVSYVKQWMSNRFEHLPSSHTL
ncbi:MAG: phosphoenolpyruvate--protein phosphotransferase [Sphaerochaetaceae bacterium]|nr:phosphoenolpyruvate--protein phosphotransferase [Sphaerochaetaceae bacterium]MDC7236880.1 phosphoenolpyruvate--protein phosphotransferase [Sphaerochaetaceae bacterium]MDC7248385.1 phosphoenolpyruvate--protein phosphotransferase [Sphaerochaetaceae bacterium]